MALTGIHLMLPLLATGMMSGAMLAWRHAARSRARIQRSLLAEGVVSKVEYNSSQQVFPTVQFTTAVGHEVCARPSSTTNFHRFSVGQQVRLRYDPEDPKWVAIDGLPTEGAVNIVVAVAPAVASIGLFGATFLVLT